MKIETTEERKNSFLSYTYEQMKYILSFRLDQLPLLRRGSRAAYSRERLRDMMCMRPSRLSTFAFDAINLAVGIPYFFWSKGTGIYELRTSKTHIALVSIRIQLVER